MTQALPLTVPDLSSSSEEFEYLLLTVKNHTMIDRERLWMLWHLAQQAPSSGAFVEIGCWRGGSSFVIAQAAHRAQIQPTMWVFDTFSGVPLANPCFDNQYRGGEHADCSVKDVVDLFRNKDLTGTGLVVIAGKFPNDGYRTGYYASSGWVVPSTLAFVHIDVDIYQSAHDSFWSVWNRVLPGGMVVFDDYRHSETAGITAVVDYAAAELRDDAVFIPTSQGQAIFVKRHI